MAKKKALIIGGGPAGLTAAYELVQHTDIIPVVVEMTEHWGGISRTENHNGNRIDIGGHRFFSKSDEIMEWWQNIMPIESSDKKIEITYQNKQKTLHIENEGEVENPDNVMLVRNRKSRIYSNKKFFNYPISLSLDTLGKLGYWNTVLIGFSYLRSAIFPVKPVVSLEDFFINRFGRRLYRTFFKDYTEKVWGVSCTDISAEWGEQRIKGLSVTKTILHALKKPFKRKGGKIGQKKTETSLIEYFLYPKYGPGQMWELVADKVENGGGILKMKTRVIHLHTEQNNITSVEVKDMRTGETETLEADYFFSTMPVRHLFRGLNCDIPENVRKVAQELKYRDFITVGLLIDQMNQKLDDNWIYIQENYVKVGRLQIFNNWSPYMVKDQNQTWVGLEYFCTTEDDLWKMQDSDMISIAVKEMIDLGFINKEENVLDSKVIRVPKAYPAYTGSYENFELLKEFTDTFENLFLVGRNGMHRYNNQDHSMLTAIKAVEQIKNQSIDKETIWSINTEQDYQEEK